MPDDRRSYDEELKEQIHSLDKQIAGLNNCIDSFKRTLDKIDERLDEHNKTLYGNGKGHSTRLSLLEEHKKNGEKHAFAAWVAFIGLVVKSGWDWITGK